MNNVDYPFSRHTVGFDRIFRLLDATANLERTSGSYPPYNIEEMDENNWHITLAVAGFHKDEIEIIEEQGLLKVKAISQDSENENERKWLHRGIAARSFERRFNLASHIRVKKAKLENGLLQIALEREIPEELKPKQIQIENTSSEKAKMIQQDVA